ncbi:DUF6630 family protein [Stenotrophomonas mori]|uniref:DUF6630 domain-containing protein n=1 Tax=Stenotrophomonas mori TaxID=2871096 RepID=A0ABT0SJ01_9GAMM|nr:hypothetical protein [Stenotrophomonas mori]
MPDNSADYEDSDERVPEFDGDDHPARVWNLLWLINPGDEDAALQQFDAWREARAGAEEDGAGEAWLWDLKDAIDWRAGFHVDAADVESFVAALDELAARWNLAIDWGGDLDDEDFTADLDVATLMGTAYDRLREHGYSLWAWNTGGGSHAGWIALSRDDEAMLALCSLLGVEVRPGSDAF